MKLQLTVQFITWKILTGMWSAMTAEGTMNFDSGAHELESELVFSPRRNDVTDCMCDYCLML